MTKQSSTRLLVAGLALVGGAVQAQTVLTVSSWLPPSHTVSKTQAKWCESLAFESQGRLRCNILPQAVAPAPATYDAVKNGQVDVSFVVPGYNQGRFVLTQMAELPFLGDRAEPISIAYQRVASRHPAFLNEHAGLKVLSMFTHGPGGLYTSKKPVAQIDDAKGMKIRVGGGMVVEVAKLLGVEAVPKPANETAALIGTGTIDGVLFPKESIEAFKVDKLVHYGFNLPGGLYNTSFLFLMNQDRYNRLSPDERRIVDRLSGEAAARMFGRGWDDQDRKGMAYMQVAGVKQAQGDARLVSEFKARAAALETRWFAEARRAGLTDPAAVLNEFRAEIAKQGQ